MDGSHEGRKKLASSGRCRLLAFPVIRDAASIRRRTVGVGGAAAATRALNLLLGPDDSLFGIPINANAGVAGTED